MSQYGLTSGGYGLTSGGYGLTSGGYGLTSGGYGLTSGGYGLTSGGYGLTSGGYGLTSGEGAAPALVPVGEAALEATSASAKAMRMTSMPRPLSAAQSNFIIVGSSDSSSRTTSTSR
jgi:hypothetical protein